MTIELEKSETMNSEHTSDIKRKILSDTSFIVVVGYLKQFINMIKGFIIAKLLDPALYGYFNGLGLISLYNSHGHLGILHGMTRELSLKKGELDLNEYDRIKNNGMTAIGILGLIIALGLITYTIIFPSAHSSYVIWGIRAFAVLAFLQQIEWAYQALLQVDHRFTIISKARVLYSISNLILVVLLIFAFGFYGLLISMIVAMFFENFYLIRKGKFIIKFLLETEVLGRMLKIGAPLSLGLLVMTAMMSVDRIMIISYLRPEDLGFYGIALTFNDVIVRIPENIAYVMYPRILEHYGKFKNVRELKSLYEKSTLIISVVVSFIIGCTFIAIPILINYILPKYEQAISVSRIIIFAIFFLSIHHIARRIMIAMGVVWKLLIIQIIGVLINLALANYFLSQGNGIDSVAFAAGISYLIYSAMMIQYIVGKFFTSRIRSYVFHLKTYIPILFTIIVLFVIDYIEFMPGLSPSDFKTDSINTLASLALFIGLYSPVFFYLNKRTDSWSIIKGLVRKNK